MRLVVDHSLAAANVSVPCYVCGAMTRLADTVIDLDGPAYQAYYCPTHAPHAPVAPCATFGCNRPHAEISK